MSLASFEKKKHRVLVLFGLFTMLFPLVMTRWVHPFITEYIFSGGNSIWVRNLSVTIGGLGLFLISFWAINAENLRVSQLGLSISDAFDALPFFVIIILGINLLPYSLTLLTDATAEISYGGYNSLGKWIGRAATIWIFVGLAEELAFRGYLQNKIIDLMDFDSRKGSLLGLIMSSIFFSLIHIPQRIYVQDMNAGMIIQSLLLLIVIGTVFGLIYLLTDNLVFTGLLHGAWDVKPFFMSIFLPENASTLINITILASIFLPVIAGISGYYLWSNDTMELSFNH